MARKFTWTPLQLERVKRVQEILKKLEKYLPLMLRAVHYQLVGKVYENTKSNYTVLSNLLKWARIDNYVSWDAIDDRGRDFYDLRGYANLKSFVDLSAKEFLYGYARDLMQTQKRYIEIWVEKESIATVFTKVAERYTIPVLATRGFNSMTLQKKFADRLSNYENKDPLILAFGDLDPSGVAIPKAYQTTLEKELGVKNLEVKRVALSKEDVIKYKLPYSFDAVKEKDTRTPKYLEEYGNVAVELDALSPAVLEEKIKTAIEAEIDPEAFNKEVKKHNAEVKKIKKIKAEVQAFLDSKSID